MLISLVLSAAALCSWPDLRARTRLRPARPRRGQLNVAGLLQVSVLPLLGGLGALLAGAGGLLAACALAVLALWWWRSRGAFRQRLARTAALASGLRLLVGELRAGAHPSAAAEGAAVDAEPAVATLFRDVAATVRLGGDAVAVLTAASGPGLDPPRRDLGAWFRPPRSEQSAPGDPLARAGRAWALAERHGVALAELLDSVRRDLDHRVAFARDVEARLAGPRATAAVLAGLPVLGLLLGQASGAAAPAVLADTLFGQLLLVVGVGLLCAGVVWTSLLTESVARP